MKPFIFPSFISPFRFLLAAFMLCMCMLLRYPYMRYIDCHISYQVGYCGPSDIWGPCRRARNYDASSHNRRPLTHIHNVSTLTHLTGQPTAECFRVSIAPAGRDDLAALQVRKSALMLFRCCPLSPCCVMLPLSLPGGGARIAIGPQRTRAPQKATSLHCTINLDSP